MAAATTAAYVSVPSLRIGGSADPVASGNLLRLRTEEDIAGMCSCEVTLRNWGLRDGRPGYLYLSRDVLDFGAELAVFAGPDPDQQQLFAGRVSAIEACYPADDAAQATVFAEDGLQALRMARRTRTFEDATTRDIAEQIAADHGLTADVDVPGPKRRTVAQLNLSDLAFLRAAARADDGEVWLDGRTLHLARRPDRAGGEPPLLRYGLDLLSFTVRADLAHQVTTLGVTGWSVADKEGIDELADDTDLGSELGDLTGGSAVLQAAFGERVERLVRAQPLAADDARAWARAAYLERARRFVRGTAVTGGTPGLRVGGTVTLAGLGGMFDGDYAVTRVVHTVDLADGYRTRLDLERPGIGGTS